MLLACVCLANLFSIVASSLNIPRSSVVLIGEKVEMNCSVTGSGFITWSYTSWNTSTEREIYRGGDIVASMRSRYKIDKNISGQHNLIIDSVDSAHAGRYSCTSGTEKTLRIDIELIVLGSHPVCDSHINGTQHDEKGHQLLYLWCSISYTGNANPVSSWTKSSKQQNITTNTNWTTTSGSIKGPLTSTSSTKEQLHSNDSGAVFQYRITFRMLDRNTIKDFEYTWNYTLYGPRNISIVEYGDRLECSADGNPTPIYRWTDVETNVSTDGPVYLTNRTNEKEHTLECTAANIFTAKNKNYTIKGRPIDSGTTQVVLDLTVTALAIGGLLLCLFTIAVIVLCVVHRKGQTDASSNRPDASLDTDPNSYGNSAIQVTSGNDPFQSTYASYCALNIQPSTTEESRLYCELQLSADYVNQGKRRRVTNHVEQDRHCCRLYLISQGICHQSHRRTSPQRHCLPKYTMLR